MHVRVMRRDDLGDVVTLFTETVHTVNARDYDTAQLNAWAPRPPDTERWRRSFEGNVALVAEIDGVLVGFGDVTTAGYIDRLYVAGTHQGRGVASAILAALERAAERAGAGEFTTHASITALPFFAHRGYAIRAKQWKRHGGVGFTNYLLGKGISPGS